MKLEVPAVPLPMLRRAASSTLDAVCRFATGLSDDYQAVIAGLTLPWSSGPVEGHINRLNMLKRQMFGRAHLDLLGHCFLRAPRERAPRSSGRGCQSRSRPPRRPHSPRVRPAAASSARLRPHRGFKAGQRACCPTSYRDGSLALVARTRPSDEVDISYIKYSSFNYHQNGT
jgi:hypothetical protein